MRVHEGVDALASRVRRLPPPTWTGPTADAFADSLARTARVLDAATAALLRAAAASRRAGSS